MTWVDNERLALAEMFRTVEPSAATLCTGWTTRHLLAHLVQRENHPLANIADQISRRPPGEEKHLAALADTAQSDSGYQALIHRFADGPPRWSPMNWAGEQLNLLEFVIHHEDVRRGGSTAPPPRNLPVEERRLIFQRLPLLARLAYRKAPVGIVLAGPAGNRHIIKKNTRQVELQGDSVELALYVSGRQRAASVELHGSSEATEAFLEWMKTH